MASLEESSAVSVEELAMEFRSNHPTVHCPLQKLGMIPKLGKWLPLKFSEINHQIPS